MRSTLKTAAAGFMLVAAAGLTGCATNGDVAELQDQINAVKATADQAAADAAAAKAAAESANATAQETNEKLDRMYKASMQK